MNIDTGSCVIVAVISSDDAGNRLCKGTVEICIVVIVKQAVALHDLVRDDDELGVTADPSV